jgi:glycerophosphoryl diester phosphodiesterase
MYQNTNCKLQAHRGVCTDAPENTMAAFRAAVAQGYDIIEFDPKFTSDNVCVVHHDRTLNRTDRICGKPLPQLDVPIKDVSFADLAEIDVGVWFAPEFTGEHIPTLAQVLDYVTYADMEVKIDNCIQRFTAEQIDILFDIVEKHGNTPKVGLTASDLALLRRYAERFPGAPLHYDGPVSQEALDELAGFSQGHPTTVWMRMANELTGWNTTPPVDATFAKMVKSRFLLGIWILENDQQMQQILPFQPDVVETTGGIKPAAYRK